MEKALSSTTVISSRLDLIRDLQQKIDQCLSDLVVDRPFALLDFPNYDNIGDSAIYLGEIRYFERRGMRPAYVSTTNNCSWPDLERQIGDGPIFLQGGGNFGDIWPWFQPFREDVLARNRGRPVIQLPQTIFFASQERLDQTARIIERHGAFTLLVRDHRSFELARKAFQCDVRMCPDMAFQIGPVDRGPAHTDLRLHLRDDKEAARDPGTAGLSGQPGVIEADWPAEAPGWITRVDRSHLPQLGMAFLQGGQAGFRRSRYRNRAATRVQRGFDSLQASRYLITDRLHGHIMAFLLGIPQCVLDNSYGKTSGFMKAWGTQIDNVHVATSVEEAVEVLKNEEGLTLRGA